MVFLKIVVAAPSIEVLQPRVRRSPLEENPEEVSDHQEVGLVLLLVQSETIPLPTLSAAGAVQSGSRVGQRPEGGHL